MLKPKKLLTVPLGSKLSETHRDHLIVMGIKWFCIALLAYIDSSFNCIIIRLLTAFFVPYSACHVFECGMIFLGLFNVVTCAFAAFDIEVFVNSVFSDSIKRSFANKNPAVKKADTLSESVGNLLEESLFQEQSEYIPPTLRDYYTTRKFSELSSAVKNPAQSHDSVYTEDQVEEIMETGPTLAYTMFEPKYNKYDYYQYHQSPNVEEDDSSFQSANRSQLDLLDISEHYANNPNEHPLEAAKSKPTSSNTATSGHKRGKSPAAVSESGGRLSTSYRHHTNTGSSNRSPKFLMTQKPTVTPITKVFSQCRINGDRLITMTEELRQFLSRRIICPLAKEIEKINAFFHENPRTRNVIIGKTPIADIEKVFSQTQEDEILNLPYVLAFLRLHSNYTHLVKRILTWAKSEYIFDFFPDSVTQPTTTWPDSFLTSRITLPTDSDLIFRIFCFYMDTHCGLYPITYPYPCDLPFTRLHTLQEGKSPSDSQLSSSGYYIEINETTPATFKFNISRYPAIVTPPTTNALLVILLALVYGHGAEWDQTLNRSGFH